MAGTVLITQCIQRDFVDLIGAHDPLPNLLHVGHSEAARLLGTDPSVGPLAQLINWAHAVEPDDIDIIHIRDWHDPNDPAQREHLTRFGEHCIRGTAGARLVLAIDDDAASAPNKWIVSSRGLNDFEGTGLLELLTRMRRSQPDGRLRAGVIGVWTEAKVSFLLYDLKTRVGINELATCSALTAGASRAKHFQALSQLEQILGVECFESVAEFVDWLDPGAKLDLPPNAMGFEPHIGLVSESPALNATDRAIISYLFRDSTHVDLDPLAGGYSGALVLRATSQDALGHRQAPAVVKLGPNRTIAQERVAFEQVEEVLGNNAPRVRGFVDLGDRAGLKYSYAAMGQGQVRTLQSMFAADSLSSRLMSVLRAVFEEILGPLYAAARYERLPLFEHYQFSPKWTSAVRASVEAIATDASGDVLTLPGGLSLPNVCTFYEDFLVNEPVPNYDYHYVSYQHGDLNPSNVLVDAHENVWVIDFFHSGAGHVLKDFAKFENDLLYVLTPVESNTELDEALAITRALRTVDDLRAPLPTRPPQVRSRQMVRAWNALEMLREIGGRFIHEDRHPLQLDLALLRYGVHTLSFPESTPLQKRWALASTCWLADEIVTTVRAERKLRADWLDPRFTEPGRLGITLCPGRRDRDRNLEDDLLQLRADGTTTLVSLMTDAELQWAGVADLGTRAGAAGLAYRRFPIADQGVPEPSDAIALVHWCADATKRGETVVLACMGGLGRSGLIAACFLVDRGLSPEEAIAAVRDVRSPRALETIGQEDFISVYAAAELAFRRH